MADQPARLSEVESISPPKRREAQVIDAAARVFARKGYPQSTTRDIADDLGIRQSGLYYYFASKEDALLKVCRLGAEGHLEGLVKLYGSELCPSEKLDLLIEQQMRAMQERYDYVKVFLTQRQFLPPEQRRLIKVATQQYGRLVEQILADGVKSGSFRSDLDCTMTMRAVLGMMNWAVFTFDPEKPQEIERMVTAVRVLAKAGVQNPTGPDRAVRQVGTSSVA